MIIMYIYVPMCTLDYVTRINIGLNVYVNLIKWYLLFMFISIHEMYQLLFNMTIYNNSISISLTAVLLNCPI